MDGSELMELLKERNLSIVFNSNGSATLLDAEGEIICKGHLKKVFQVIERL